MSIKERVRVNYRPRVSLAMRHYCLHLLWRTLQGPVADGMLRNDTGLSVPAEGGPCSGSTQVTQVFWFMFIPMLCGVSVFSDCPILEWGTQN